jgi:hypothetical protein
MIESQYRCWYCPLAHPDFSGAVLKCIAEHGDNALTIRKQTLNQSTGNVSILRKTTTLRHENWMC